MWVSFQSGEKTRNPLFLLRSTLAYLPFELPPVVSESLSLAHLDGSRHPLFINHLGAWFSRLSDKK